MHDESSFIKFIERQSKNHTSWRFSKFCSMKQIEHSESRSSSGIGFLESHFKCFCSLKDLPVPVFHWQSLIYLFQSRHYTTPSKLIWSHRNHTKCDATWLQSGEASLTFCKKARNQWNQFINPLQTEFEIASGSDPTFVPDYLLHSAN